MDYKSAIDITFNAIPLIRGIWRWLLERNMEVIAKPHYEDMGYFVYAPNLVEGFHGSVSAILDLTIINHRTDRLERIIACWVELRKRRCFFWRTTLAKISVNTNSDSDYHLDYPITNITLESMGKPYKRTIRLSGELKDFRMPRWSELVLIFKMVGPMRKYECRLDTVDYNPKRITNETNKESKQQT